MAESRLIELITSKLSGSISNTELDELNKLLEGNRDYRQLHEQVSVTWNRAGEYRADVHSDVERAWKNFETKRAVDSKSVLFNPRTLLRLAAVLVLGLGYLYYVLNNKVETIELVTGPNETVEAVLPDGTHIWLNELSSITYPKAFEKDVRNVTMTGGVYFKVERDEKSPFTIQGNQTKVRVLGTSFEIDDYPDRDYVSVEVNSGKVEFSSDNAAASVILEKGMQGVFDPAQQLIVTSILQSNNFNSWVTGKLEFKDVIFDQVIKELSEYFKVEFELSNKRLSACKFTGTFENPKLKDVMEVLSVSLNLTFVKTGDKYVIAGAGCSN